MKKRLFLIIIMCIMACFILAGCQSEDIKEKDVTNNNTFAEIKAKTNTVNNTPKTSNSNSTTNTTKNAISNNKPSTNEELKPTEIKKQYDYDLPLGFEIRHVTVNGKEVAVNIQTSGSSKQQKNGPYYIYYEVRAGQDIGQNKFKLVKEGIHHLEGYGIEMLKTYDIEVDAGTNYEFFEFDFTTSAYKGTDKEYVAISIPAGTEDKNQTSLILATDEGKLIGDFTADVVKDITLTGKNVEKYKSHSGDTVFSSIKDGKITYLVPTEKMYKTDSKGKKVLNNSLDVLELDEYSVDINKDKATAKKTGEIYKITNAKGKTFGFGKFRH